MLKNQIAQPKTIKLAMIAAICRKHYFETDSKKYCYRDKIGGSYEIEPEYLQVLANVLETGKPDESLKEKRREENEKRVYG